jgi:hypothetical protein
MPSFLPDQLQLMTQYGPRLLVATVLGAVIGLDRRSETDRRAVACRRVIPRGRHHHPGRAQCDGPYDRRRDVACGRSGARLRIGALRARGSGRWPCRHHPSSLDAA